MNRSGRRLRVLVLSRNYPNPTLPQLGLWVEGATTSVSRHVDVHVVAPVPWFPPSPAISGLPTLADLRRFRRVPRRQMRSGVVVDHPRFVVGPGMLLFSQEASTYHAGVRRTVARLAGTAPFDLIHAHFSYPDGVVAEALGRRYGVPVVVTEHAPWRPWVQQMRWVRRQVVPAARRFDCHVAVSRAVRDSVVELTGDPDRVRVVPNGVDEALFKPAAPPERDPDKILFVGLPRPTKGVDVLLDAMVEVLAGRPTAHLVVVGGAIYRDTRPYLAALQAACGRPPLRGRVRFEGLQPPQEVARHMATSAVLVLPSRLESFGAVLIEAMACGTPVVSTRSGGPEDVVTPEVGHLVPVDNPPALARAILDVLAGPSRYPVEQLRQFALERFSWSSVAERLVTIYREAVNG